MLTTSVTATTTHQLMLKPTLKKKLLTALRTYVELGLQKKAIEFARSKQSKIVEEIQVELGESSLDIEGFKSTIVAPIRKVFDKKLFVALGGNLDLYERAMVATPGTPYMKITPPGNGHEDEIS